MLPVCPLPHHHLHNHHPNNCQTDGRAGAVAGRAGVETSKKLSPLGCNERPFETVALYSSRNISMSGGPWPWRRRLEADIISGLISSVCFCVSAAAFSAAALSLMSKASMSAFTFGDAYALKTDSSNAMRNLRGPMRSMMLALKSDHGLWILAVIGNPMPVTSAFWVRMGLMYQFRFVAMPFSSGSLRANRPTFGMSQSICLGGCFLFWVSSGLMVGCTKAAQPFRRFPRMALSSSRKVAICTLSCRKGGNAQSFLIPYSMSMSFHTISAWERCKSPTMSAQ
mmetsp:Transcript_2044/g.5366  ORF Transcript_2044/g.5366 Transcript_2044/m.5366 type:complete len:282 (-) Transcript_2044:428-1273(-)